jgi:hypothetical protein
MATLFFRDMCQPLNILSDRLAALRREARAAQFAYVTNLAFFLSDEC